jgi:ABC-type xylose transport system substrate-binding protein
MNIEELMETEACQKWQADQSIFMASTLDLIRAIKDLAQADDEVAQFQTDLESLVMTLKNL